MLHINYFKLPAKVIAAGGLALLFAGVAGASTDDADINDEIEARIHKIGTINIDGEAMQKPTLAAEAGPSDGPAIYQGKCAACHATGAAGAPKTGDKAGWADRIAKGEATLITNATNGIGAMPAKGGYADLSDADITAAVQHMIGESQ